MRNTYCEELALRAAGRFLNTIGAKSANLTDTAVVLGTGWGGHLALENEQSVPLKNITGFENLCEIELSGHARTLRYGFLNGKPLLILDGRIHLNETPPSPFQMVRLQIEMLVYLGVEKLILTGAAGSLRSNIVPGDLVIVDDFLTILAPPMPLFGGEFCSPGKTLNTELQGVARESADGLFSAYHGAYAMLRGPFFEGITDKEALRELGASAVGMSMLPEACIAALYSAQVLGLCFITNSAREEHSHEENVRRVKLKSAELGTLLERIISVSS